MDSQDLLRQSHILELLREDREQGAELLLETYTPLLWSVCRRRLSDPEDIKECVNDVFTKFCLNPDQYDPQQSSLKNYLAMMADRRAVSYYRSNQRRSEAEASAMKAGFEHLPELSGDLDEALSSLPEEDARIIRLKYYGGMTYREIAAQMGITEAAAKKRGARSLKKLAKWLVIGLLIAALLAGCTYVVHYFRYARGIGIVQESETAVYQLAEAVEPICANGMEILPLSVTYSEDSLLVQIAFLPKQSEYSSNQYRAMAGAYDLTVSGIGSASAQYSSDKLCEYILAVPHETLTTEENGSVHLELTLSPTEEGTKNVASIHGYDMDLSALSWTVILDEVAAVQDLTDLGYYLETTYVDFLVLTDWEFSGETNDTYTLISLCPIYKTEGLILSDLISTCYNPLNGREQEYITLRGADGTEYPVYRTAKPAPDTSFTEFTLWFKNLPDGEYTLKIPSLCFRAKEEPTVLTLTLPDADGETLSCEQILTLQDGSTLSISGVTRQSERDHGMYMTEYWVDGVQDWVPEEDGMTVWNYAVDYKLSTGGSFPLWGISFSDEFCYETEGGLETIVTTSGMHHNPGTLEHLSFGARDALGMDAPDYVQLTLHDSYYADPTPYSVSFTIK